MRDDPYKPSYILWVMGQARMATQDRERVREIGERCAKWAGRENVLIETVPPEKGKGQQPCNSNSPSH